MLQDEIKSNLSDLKDEIREYIENQVNHTKLHLVESLSRILSGFIVKLGVLYLVFFSLMFISVALAFFLGSLLNSITLGFTSVALLYLLLASIFYAIRGILVERPVIKTFIKLFFPNFDNHENKK